MPLRVMTYGVVLCLAALIPKKKHLFKVVVELSGNRIEDTSLAMRSRLKVSKLRREIGTIKREKSTLSTKLSQEKALSKNLRERLRKADSALNEAKQELADQKAGKAELMIRGCFSNKCRGAILELINLGTADAKIGKVMEIVGNMVDLKFNNLPSASTCRLLALSSINLAKRHVRTVCDEVKKNDEPLCLHSDETTKNKSKVQMFGVSRPDGGSLILGIEQVVEKSAITAFKALANQFKTPGAPKDCFDQFIAQVTCTMSDKAATQLKFNELVEHYRATVIPAVVSGWSDRSFEEQQRLMTFSNFFCQLHVIANFARVALDGLSEHEVLASGKSKVDEPAVLRLVKEVARLFGDRSAGLHACSVFLSHLFLAIASIFCLFWLLFVSEKTEMVVISELLEDELATSHLQVLGLLDQLVTGPLWRLAENSSHIFDTCGYASRLKCCWKLRVEKLQLAFWRASFLSLHRKQLWRLHQ
ncbi:unnamed protein product [Caenorhabditis auriculariae]|uniref:Uncharacterized protein n=1 Tax=Caenorhabditis auriculariae TaxID=2777116 RepID=A0A8S1HUG6_9PELO|nr:unnamed protein product [Caenorhabditis auriculariae]